MNICSEMGWILKKVTVTYLLYRVSVKDTD